MWPGNPKTGLTSAGRVMLVGTRPPLPAGLILAPSSSAVSFPGQGLRDFR